MRVRPQRSIITRRTDRRAHPVVRNAPAPPPSAPPEAHPQERRARESGGPMDRATYSCSCGMVFDAPVSTSVCCPHCGTGQAW
jgi:hypothetical protein